MGMKKKKILNGSSSYFIFHMEGEKKRFFSYKFL